MSTYAIGDVQGCAESLRRLLARIPFAAGRDHLWFAGDLVNRGPGSLEVLRLVRGLGGAATVVLGNHDLHLLARAAGVAPRRPRDTLEAVLEAPDREPLLSWLRSRPLLFREGDRLLVHAGLLPGWDAAEADRRARRVERRLRDPDDPLLGTLRESSGPADVDLRDRETVQVMTRLRICRPDGRLDLGFRAGLEEIPPGHLPWFRVPGRRTADLTIVFGHWARLGLLREPGLLALDTGCVYGGVLTAVRLEDGIIFQQPGAEAPPSA